MDTVILLLLCPGKAWQKAMMVKEIDLSRRPWAEVSGLKMLLLELTICFGGQAILLAEVDDIPISETFCVDGVTIEVTYTAGPGKAVLIETKPILISELIRQLEKIKAEHGDLPVYRNSHEDFRDGPEVKVIMPSLGKAVMVNITHSLCPAFYREYCHCQNDE